MFATIELHGGGGRKGSSLLLAGCSMLVLAYVSTWLSMANALHYLFICQGEFRVATVANTYEYCSD